MKLTTKGRYGLKAMVDIAMEYGISSVSIAALAQLQGISEPYLEQIMASLKKAGLVAATRGAQGGYSLTRVPELISVLDILSVLEGTTLVDCVSSERVDCENACSCSARPVWLKLQQKINDVLSSTTLKDMTDDYKIQTEWVKNQ